MAESAFIGNPSSSRWVVTNPTPGIIRHSVRSNKRSQLLSEAASLVPSAQDLIDRLSKHKLSPGDQNYFQTVLGGHMNEYINKYTDNPYFAFSREGKEKVRTLQSIANNPLLNEAALSFDKSAKVAEIAQRERNDNNFNVVGGSISVYDQSTGKIKRVLPDHITANMIPLTFNNELTERTRKGFFNQEDGTVEAPISYNQIAYKDVVDGINAIVGTPGTSEWESFSKELTDLNSRLKTTYRTNASQIETKLKAIFGKNGQSLLPESYMDTLLANEYANQYSQTKTIDRTQAYRNVAAQIEAIVRGETSSSVKTDESALSKAQGTDATVKQTPVGTFQSALLGWTNKNANIEVKRNGQAFAVKGQELNPAILTAYEKDGVKEGILPLNINPMFQNVLKHPGAELTTTDGKKINPAFAIPAENPNMVIYTDPVDPRKQWMEFDVYATDSHAGTNFSSESQEGISQLTGEERQYWESIGKYAKEMYDKGKLLSKFTGMEEEAWYANEDQYKVRARVQYDPDASTKAGMFVDKSPTFIDKRAMSIGSGIQSQGRITDSY